MTAPAPTKNKVAQADSPTTDALRPGDFSSVLDRNIEALKQRRKGEEAKASGRNLRVESVLGFRCVVSRASLAHANRNFDCRLGI